MLGKYFFVVGMLLSYGSFAHCSVASANDDSGMEATSQFEMIVLNADAVRTFDVLLRYQEIHDLPGAEYAENLSFMRIRGDWDHERFLYATRVERRSFVEADDGLQPEVKKWTAAVVKNDAGTFVLGKHGIVPAKHPFRNYLQDSSCPDIRLVGINEFPANFVQLQLGGFEHILSGSSSIRNMTLRPSGEYLRLESIASFLHRPQDKLQQIWMLSSETQMPLRYEVNLFSGTGRDAEKAPRRREEYEWEDHEGVYVPKVIVGQRVEATMQKNEDGTSSYLRYEVERNTRFHWFSVNEAIEEGGFSQTPLGSVEHLQILTDPVLARATSLQEK